MMGWGEMERSYVSAFFVTHQKNKKMNKLFVQLWNQKATFEGMGGKRKPEEQPINRQEAQCCSACGCALKLFQPFAFVVLLSSPRFLLFLFSCPEKAAQEARRTSLAVDAHVSRTARRLNEFALSQWQVVGSIAARLATAIFLTAVQQVVAATPTQGGSRDELA